MLVTASWRTSCKTEFAPRGIVRVLEIRERIILWFSISGKWLSILKMCKLTWVSNNKDLDGEKNRLWRIVGKIRFWALNLVLELLILNLGIPHCLTFSYQWDPKFNTSFCNIIILCQNLVYLECLFKINCKMTKWGMKKHQYHLFILR